MIKVHFKPLNAKNDNSMYLTSLTTCSLDLHTFSVYAGTLPLMSEQ